MKIEKLSRYAYNHVMDRGMKLRQGELDRLTANVRFLIQELQGRDVECKIVDRDYRLLEFQYQGKIRRSMDIVLDTVPFVAFTTAGNKRIARDLVQKAGIPMGVGEAFDSGNIGAAIEYFSSLQTAVTVKPTEGTGGFMVFCDLQEEDEVRHAIVDIQRAVKGMPFLIEQQIQAQKELRLICNRFGDYAAVQKEPAAVVGDGVSTIKELCQIETDRRMLPRRKNCLGPIEIDAVATAYLRKNGYSPDFVPPADQKIFIRANANMSTGGFCRDCTAEITPEAVRIALKILSLFPGLPFCGIDFFCSDLSDIDSYTFLEINPHPATGIHINPGAGDSYNAAAIIANVLFPESAGSGFPDAISPLRFKPGMNE